MFTVVDLGSHPSLSIDYLMRSHGETGVEVRIGALTYRLQPLDIFMLERQFDVEFTPKPSF